MKQTFTLSMSWLHTWAGLVIGWALFAIFFMGSICVFWHELDYWARPEMHAVQPAPRAAQIAMALDHLQQKAPGARIWNITLPNPDGRDPVITTTTNGNFFDTEYFLQDASGHQIVTQTHGGRFFVDFHWTLSVYNQINPIPFFIVGFTAIAFLVMCISGVVIHKRIFKDFFTFRHKASRARAWMDIHNVLGVLPLPFHFLIALTGVGFFCFTYVPNAVHRVYGSEAGFLGNLEPKPYLDVDKIKPGAAAPLYPLPPLIARAEAQIGQGLANTITIRDPGHADAVIEIARGREGSITTIHLPSVVFDGVTGRQLLGPVPRPIVYSIWDVMSSLHFAFFGGTAMRWLYLICGLAGAATIGTGLLLFTIKRSEKAETAAGGPFLWFADRMNVNAIAGPMLASAGYLWAVRLLPAGPQRTMLETLTFFGLWLLSLAYALVRDPRRAWAEFFGATALLCLGLPLLGIFAPNSSLPWTIAHGDWVTAGVDLTALVFGLAYAAAAYFAARPQAKPQRRVRRRAPALVEQVA